MTTIALIYLGCGIAMVLEAIDNAVFSEAYSEAAAQAIAKNPDQPPAQINAWAWLGVGMSVVAILAIWPVLLLQRKLGRKP